MLEFRKRDEAERQILLRFQEEIRILWLGLTEKRFEDFLVWEVTKELEEL